MSGTDAIGLPYVLGANGQPAFDYAVWQARYPELSSNCTITTASSYFLEAQLYLDNTGCSVVQDFGIRSMLLNMLVAHLAALYNGVNGNAPSQIVGRIASAAEGSVNVASEYAIPPSASAAWFIQTPYGASFWQATAPYRRFRYVPGPQPFYQPARGRWGGRW